MRFFRLTHPIYSSDLESDQRNPVRIVVQHRVPGIVCQNCGVWSSSDRLRVSVPDELRREFADVKFLRAQEWLARRNHWASRLGVTAEELRPGAEVGPPRAEIVDSPREDIVHPIPGEVWVRTRVADSLRAADFRGLDLAKVEFVGPNNTRDTPELWAIVPTGHAWRKDTDEKSLALCEQCGREGFPRPKVLAVDPERWDGTDFFTVDRNPNIILVTQKVRDLIADAGFQNVDLIEAR